MARSRRKRSPRFVRQAGQLVLALVVLGVLYLAERGVEWRDGAIASGSTRPADAEGPCRVQRVIDGDTARLHCGGETLKVRLLRVDTPEREEPGYDEATDALRRMLDGRDVHIAYEEPGVPTRGNYGRVLAYLFVGQRNVNVEMVRQGWSPFDTRWGEGRFAPHFRVAEREAREASRPGRL